jgi:hypothetical protein
VKVHGRQIRKLLHRDRQEHPGKQRGRGKALICFAGNYYISMWSAACYGDDPDVTREYYDTMAERYGTRIEGAVPDGFVLA